jgi:hypothetical protein
MAKATMDNERAGRDNGFAAADARRVAMAAATRYRKAMREFAASPTLAVWYSHLDVEDAIARFKVWLKKSVVSRSGWQRITVSGFGRTDYYLRQLRDWKYSAPIERMGPGEMLDYGELCGWTLARAHARTGDRFAIAAYLGGSGKFEQAVADFGVSYADQTERDHAALADAAASGRVEARTGV